MGATRRKVALAALATIVALAPAACSDDEGSQEAFCAKVGDVPLLAAVLANSTERDPESVRAGLEEARSAYAELGDVAPGEISDETDAVIGVIDLVIDAVDEHPDDATAAAAQIRQEVAEVPDVSESAAAMVAYARDRCDVELDAGLGASTSVAGDAATTTEG